MTTSERLLQISGAGPGPGAAAALLLSAASGVTTGEALVAYSGYPMAEARIHLLAERGGNYILFARRRNRR